MVSVIVGRLAPSPTGAQHLGNARTFLATYWSSLHQHGRLILRIEDIDSPRVKPWAIQQAIDDLAWLGIRWDEGPERPGPNSPYVQTERTDGYARAIHRLRSDNRIYPCTCTRKDIANAASAPHDGDHVVVYPGTCSKWKEADPMPPPGTYCWRFRVSDGPVTFHDRVAGIRSLNPAIHLGDFPVTRKSGEAAYQLAVVVDDISMGITEVVRGDDLIDSTFWQLELYEALGRTPPVFMHLPLVVGADGRRLAKRHGDTRLSHLRDAGVQPIEIVRWAASSFDLKMPQVEADVAVDFERLHHELAACWDCNSLNLERVVPPSDWLGL